MATFLFLVGVTVTTLLLLAIAADEVLNTTRRLLSRWAVNESVAIDTVEYHERPTRLSEEAARAVRAQPARVPVRSKPVADKGDWVPDRAA